VKFLVSAAAVAALAWIAGPWVSMAYRGTIDRCTLETMRSEVRVPSPRCALEDRGRPDLLRMPDSRDLPAANY
jgi:hypothetical protein